MKYRSGTPRPPLPDRTLEYLIAGAPKGSRNSELFDAACQFRDANFPLAEALDQLLPRAHDDGLSEVEARHTIDSAFSRLPREPAGTRVLISPITTSSSLPAPIENGFTRLLDVCFEPGEFVAVAPATENDLDEVVPSRGVTFTREEWKTRVQTKGGIERMFSTKLGLFLRINPMREGGARNEDVTSFRHALVEFDGDEAGNDMPKDQQYAAIVASGLPVSVLIDSGNKSLHAWVRVNAKDAQEYKQRVEQVWEVFGGKALDRKNRNPSRLSRCPGGRRTVNGDVCVQQLLALGLGARSWSEWESHQQNATDPLPEPMLLSELANYDVENDPNNILGHRWICRGASLVIVGQSGVGKSALCMQMLILWALGLPAFNIAPVRPLRSLIIQAENDKGDLAEMYQGVCKGMKLTAEQQRLVSERIRIYRDVTHTGPEFIGFARRLIARDRPDLVWIDPLLSFIGDDINAQRVVSDFTTRLNVVAQDTGVAWCLMHHTGKPPKEPKAMSHWTPSDLAYMGLGSSLLTNWSRELAVLVRLKAPDGFPPTFQLSMTKRRLRAGMKDINGAPSESIFLRHAQGSVICWEECEAPPAPKKKESTCNYKIAGRPSNFDEQKFREAIAAFGGTVTRGNVKTIAEAMKAGTRTIWRWWKKLSDGEEEAPEQVAVGATSEE